MTPLSQRLNFLLVSLALALSLALAAAVSLAAEHSGAAAPRAHAVATCDDYANQREAQNAADTRDPHGDGIYCESLPCPCAGPGSGGGGVGTGGGGTNPAGCSRPSAVQRLKFSATKYRHIRAHFRAAVRKGWPRTLVVNRPGADARRDRLLEDIPTRPGFDRDEYPPAVGRGNGLVRGSNPKGWMADVMYVDSSENQSHGASLGGKLRRFCNGTRFRYVFQ